MIFRDDDIGFHAGNSSKLKRFKEVHSLFNKYGVIHTIAIVTNDIEKDKALIKYIKSQKNIDVQLHCHEHIDYSKDLQKLHENLPKAVEIATRLFKKPTTLFPPWNASSIGVERIAWKNGLKVSTNKISLSQYLKGVKGDVINFHYWADECEDLEQVLKKYVNK
jgi:peptidoglycan/xylan/chitin deacetylase (PgdA/CDA1 family)